MAFSSCEVILSIVDFSRHPLSFRTIHQNFVVKSILDIFLRYRNIPRRALPNQKLLFLLIGSSSVKIFDKKVCLTWRKVKLRKIYHFCIISTNEEKHDLYQEKNILAALNDASKRNFQNVWAKSRKWIKFNDYGFMMACDYS